jgi:2-haloacid dehalogenase/putative hydrolase of the HAD superfamily
MVFSSDYTSMKPSPKLFQLALNAFTAEKSQMVFVGDSLVHDIRGAKAIGLSTIWINNGKNDGDGDPAAIDFVVDSLLNLY